MLLWLLMTLLTLSACTEEDEDEGTTKWFSKNFDLEIKNCDRVGKHLVADFKLINKSGKDITSISLNGQSVYNMCEDASGEQYYSEFRIKGGNWSGSITTYIAAGDSLVGSIRIKNFDASQSSKWVKLDFTTECPQLSSESADVVKNHMPVSDLYLTSRGIQTNNRGLEYEYLSSWTEKEYSYNTFSNELFGYIRFRVTNNTGRNINNFMVNTGDGWAEDIMDDLGNEYNYLSVAMGNSTNYQTSVTSNFANGDSKVYTFRIAYLNASARRITGELNISSTSNNLEYDYIHFYNIAINGDN